MLHALTRTLSASLTVLTSTTVAATSRTLPPLTTSHSPLSSLVSLILVSNILYNLSTPLTGCQPVDAYNILVDPTGAQYNCTKTQLTPDNTTVTSTCPIEKDSLVSGDWSVLLYSNNGACQPFNARRDFVLSVGVQQTTTVTPMVVFTTTTTPIVSKTTVSTSVQQFYAPTPTVTSSKSVKNPTRTVTPIKATVLTTTTLKVKTITSYDLLVSNKIVTKTAKCTISSTAVEADPSATATAQVARRSAEDIIGSSMNEFLEARAERLDNMIVKRAPDQATVTDIITVASQFSTSYVIMTAPVVTAISTCKFQPVVSLHDHTANDFSSRCCHLFHLHPNGCHPLRQRTEGCHRIPSDCHQDPNRPASHCLHLRNKVRHRLRHHDSDTIEGRCQVYLQRWFHAVERLLFAFRLFFSRTFPSHEECSSLVATSGMGKWSYMESSRYTPD
jgi:hypothetical protein